MMNVECIYCYGEFKHGLARAEVNELLKHHFGSKRLGGLSRSFGKFMCGQTVMRSLIADEILYYRCDVDRFISNVKRKDEKK